MMRRKLFAGVAALLIGAPVSKGAGAQGAAADCVPVHEFEGYLDCCCRHDRTGAPDGLYRWFGKRWRLECCPECQGKLIIQDGPPAGTYGDGDRPAVWLVDFNARTVVQLDKGRGVMPKQNLAPMQHPPTAPEADAVGELVEGLRE